MLDILTLAAAKQYTETVAGELESKIYDLSLFKFKGTKEYISELPTTGNEAGDVWHVEEDSNEYVWVVGDSSSEWESFGGLVDLSGKLDKNQGSQNYGKILAVGQDGEVELINFDGANKRWLFVDTKPTEDIDQNAIYLRKHARYFPPLVDGQGNSLIQKIEGVDQKVAVTEDGKFIRFNTTGNTFYSGLNTIKAFEYDIYITDGTSWTYSSSSASGGDTSWATAMGWDITKTYSNILYSNCDFRYTGAFKHYDPSNNRAKVDGTAENTSTLPPYIFMMWQYNGSTWKELGTCDFTELFNKVETNKQDKNLTSSNITIATTDWVSDSTYNDYPYKKDITISGVTSDMVADVYFNGASAVLGIMAPFCETGTDTVTVYCSTNDTAVTIDKVVVIQ